MFIERSVEITNPIIETVRGIKTLGTGINVYENAHISIERFYSNDVFPTALYILEPNIRQLQAISETMDIFSLTDVTNTLDGEVIAPPVVEVCDGIPCIVDGIHRFTLAGRYGVPLNAIYIEGAALPIVSYPVNWSEVISYEERPTDPKLMRRLRVEDRSEVLRYYYRDFSVLGSKGRRPRSGQQS